MCLVERVEFATFREEPVIYVATEKSIVHLCKETNHVKNICRTPCFTLTHHMLARQAEKNKQKTLETKKLKKNDKKKTEELHADFCHTHLRVSGSFSGHST